VLESLFQLGDLVRPCFEASLDNILFIFLKRNESLGLSVCLWWIDFDIIVVASDGVDPSVVELAHALFHVLLKEAHEVWIDSHRLQKVRVNFVFREAIEDPAIVFAVALVDASTDQRQKDLVGASLASADSISNLDLAGMVRLAVLLQQLLRAHQYEAERLGHNLGLGRFARAGWSDQNHMRWPQRSVVSVDVTEEASQVVACIVNSLLAGIKIEDEVSKGLFALSVIHEPVLVHSE